ncbi:dTDP-4-dehydrorhamnose reductase family protein [Paenibacillus sp. UNC451MF]|uniref:dTDP-4-dehydrorhamnose reductase family protein n=1 Tax=Paenibacillus sp. UNC451MF TaxID=1449063 RepID=UPI00048CDBC2|nr:SDR family oxidoreductase [Paenibacillus sp. UNC451MF]
MRILIIGGEEIVGRVLVPYLLQETRHEVFYTTRLKGKERKGLYLNPSDEAMVEKLVEIVTPDVIVNGTSIMNDMARLHEIEAYRINGLLPHQLARLADQRKIRFIHMSTDGVFSGVRGHYEERHVPEGTSVYAKTKALGEIKGTPHLTIRVSIVGPEGGEGIGLLDWFLRQKEVRGFINVPWNGLTSLEVAKFIHYVLERGRRLNGIIHLTAPERISKYDLLLLIRSLYERSDITIQPNDAVELDRTLKSTRRDVGYRVPSYVDMLTELRDWMRSNATLAK